MFTATENSGFAFGCLKKTRNPDKICMECVKTMKCPGIRKKEERLRNADVKQTKYKLFTCYPKEARKALRNAGKQKKKESDRADSYKKQSIKCHNIVAYIANQKLSSYVRTMSQILKSGKRNVNEVTDYVLDDIQKDATALSKFGY